MAAGLGALRLPPSQFWSMTPRELAAAIRGGLGIEARPRPLDHFALRALMARFPDKA